jgi:hypothetical protein
MRQRQPHREHSWMRQYGSPSRLSRYIYTIARAAEMLGEDEEWLQELAEQLEPEDGCLWIYDTNDRATLGFTERGIESLKELSLDQKR